MVDLRRWNDKEKMEKKNNMYPTVCGNDRTNVKKANGCWVGLSRNCALGAAVVGQSNWFKRLFSTVNKIAISHFATSKYKGCCLPVLQCQIIQCLAIQQKFRELQWKISFHRCFFQYLFHLVLFLYSADIAPSSLTTIICFDLSKIELFWRYPLCFNEGMPKNNWYYILPINQKLNSDKIMVLANR